MASAEQAPVSLSVIRRRLIAAAGAAQPPAPQAPLPDPRSETVDFEFDSGELSAELERIAKPPAPAATEYDDVEVLLKRYQAEKGISPTSPSPNPSSGRQSQLPPPAARRGPAPHSAPAANGNFHGELLRPRSGHGGLPPLTTPGNNELDRLRTENAELKEMVAEYKQLVDGNDLQDWEQKIQEAGQLLEEKDQHIESLRKQVEEWNEKLKTNRFVPSDDDLAQMADELDQERSKLAQERKQHDQERKQLKEDEESLMKQMREMEVGMAKDRAELARQRTELQRLQNEVRHELELLQRGDATVKERMQQFQRRQNESAQGTAAAPRQSMASIPAPLQSPPPADEPRPRESGVFKRLFGQG